MPKLEVTGDDRFCTNCEYLQSHEDSATCESGYWGRATLDGYHSNLWGYWNETTDQVITFYPVGEYDNDLDWTVIAVRPMPCLLADTKEEW